MLCLQEILSSSLPSGGYGSSMIGHSTENLEVRLQILSKGHDGGDVATSVAIVGRGPDCYYILGGEMVFVALVDELMRTSDQ